MDQYINRYISLMLAQNFRTYVHRGDFYAISPEFNENLPLWLTLQEPRGAGRATKMKPPHAPANYGGVLDCRSLGQPVRRERRRLAAATAVVLLLRWRGPAKGTETDMEKFSKGFSLQNRGRDRKMDWYIDRQASQIRLDSRQTGHYHPLMDQIWCLFAFFCPLLAFSRVSNRPQVAFGPSVP